MARPATDGLSDLLLDSALEQFRKNGYSSTSIANIAAAANVATGTFYLYYDSKKDVLRACATRFHQQHQDFVQQLLGLESLSASQKLERYLLERHDRWIQEVGTASKPSDFASAMLEADPATNQKENALWTQTLNRILKEGEIQGEFAFESLERESRIFFQCLIGFFPLPGVSHPFQPTKSDLKKMIQWFATQWRPK